MFVWFTFGFPQGLHSFFLLQPKKMSFISSKSTRSSMSSAMSRSKWRYYFIKDWIVHSFHPWQLLSSLRYPSRLFDAMKTDVHHRWLDRTTVAFTNSSLVFNKGGFFSDGWGNMELIQQVKKELETGDVSSTQSDLFVIKPIKHDITWKKKSKGSQDYFDKYYDAQVYHGSFPTTMKNAAKLLPAESQECHFELVIPASWSDESSSDDVLKLKPKATEARSIVVLLPGTGEQGFVYRRAGVALPLAKKGIASIILEGPFYGIRKPSYQQGSKLRTVSDLPILGHATIEETRSLLSWLQEHFHIDQSVVAGGSMGGLHAAMIASLTPFPVGAVSWLAPPSAVPVFTNGLLSTSCNWDSLARNDVESFDLKVNKPRKIMEPKETLREILSITDLFNFPPPKQPEATIIYVATADQYVGSVQHQWNMLREKWCGAKIEYIHAGHVSGLLFEKASFIQTIEHAIDILKKEPRH